MVFHSHDGRLTSVPGYHTRLTGIPREKGKDFIGPLFSLPSPLHLLLQHDVDQ